MQEQILQLDKLKHPSELKKLTPAELAFLCTEIRQRIIRVVSEHGGHLGANLGTVELTTALLRSFDLPYDRIIWDVGHQSYAYKLLTGRQAEFEHLREFEGCCGFPVRGENEFETYGAGHAGVAISAALGMCQGSSDETPRKIIAVVGDGALNSGVALEGLNQVREHGKNLIIILNDNTMAISPNVGAMSKLLNRLMVSKRVKYLKKATKSILSLLPRSQSITNAISRLEDVIKNLLLPGGWFQDLGIRYLGPIDGHNIQALERTFASIKTDDQPVLIHVITAKGKGYAPAEKAPERFHGIGKFDLTTGEPSTVGKPGFSAAFGAAMCQAAEKHPDLCAVVAAMSAGVGLSDFARRFPDKLFDVGIAESHAVSFASGLAAAGRRPVVAVYATFMQRALDNIFHDVCLMDLPVIFALDRAGAVEDGPTHHGIYDLGFLTGMPNLIILSPGCEAEIPPMLEYALSQPHPVVIRYPRGNSGGDVTALPIGLKIESGRSVIWQAGSDLAIYAAGAEAVRALKIAQDLQQEHNLSVKVVNVRFLKPFDADALKSDLAAMPVFTLEDHLLSNGLGAIARQAAGDLKPAHKLTAIGWDISALPGFGPVDDLRRAAGLDNDSITQKIVQTINKQDVQQ